jgi:hypothetical protein
LIVGVMAGAVVLLVRDVEQHLEAAGTPQPQA